jgi:hypothetical protein
MEYKRLTQEEARKITVGTKLNFGNGEIATVTGFTDPEKQTIWSDGKWETRSEPKVICTDKDGKTKQWYLSVLCYATVETMDETAKKCEYCYKIRPANEIKEGRIRVNYAWHTGQYCFDGPCEGYAQMSAEG